MTQVPGPIQRFLDATNRGDSAAFLSVFAENAALDDWGRHFAGRDRIAEWDRTDNIGVHSRLEVLELVQEGQTYRAKVRVAGQGFNGVGTMAFRLRGDAIERLEIS